MTAARQRAERCFALARSTSFEAEREAAIGRGLAICERAGLNPDSFDIPGRSRTVAPRSPRMDPPPASRFRDDLYTRPRAPEHYDAAELNDALRRYGESLRRAAEAAGAADHERMNEALSRQFHAAAAEAKARDRARAKGLAAEKAATGLWRLGTCCYPNGDGKWTIQLKEGLAEVDADELAPLLEIAERRAAEKQPSSAAGSGATATCPVCGQYAHESRFGAPCYGCVPEART